MIKVRLWEPDTHPGYALRTVYPANDPDPVHTPVGVREGHNAQWCFAHINDLLYAAQGAPTGTYADATIDRARCVVVFERVSAENVRKNVLVNLAFDQLTEKQQALYPIQWTFGARQGTYGITVFGAPSEVLNQIREALAGYGSVATVG